MLLNSVPCAIGRIWLLALGGLVHEVIVHLAVKRWRGSRLAECPNWEPTLVRAWLRPAGAC